MLFTLIKDSTTCTKKRKRKRERGYSYGKKTFAMSGGYPSGAKYTARPPSQKRKKNICSRV